MKIFIGIPLLIIGLIFLLGFCHDEHNDPIVQPVVTPEMTAQLRQVQKDHFAAERPTLLANLTGAKTPDDYDKAMTAADPFAETADPEFLTAYTNAKTVRDQRVKERVLVEKVKAQADMANAATVAKVQAIRSYSVFLDGAEKDLRDSKITAADLQGINAYLTVIEGMAMALNEARQEKANLKQPDIVYLKGIEARLSSFQQKAFPKLRVAMVKAAGQTLWQHDVTVRAVGTRTIEFSGYWFSANAMKQSTQEQLQSILTQLRFKQARYTPYQGAAYSYYKMDTPPDAKLMLFDGSSHKPMASTL